MRECVKGEFMKPNKYTWVNPFRIYFLSAVITLFFGNFSYAENFIADHTVAKESVLRSIPEKYITAAKQSLHIMYCGTSHSSQVIDGMRGLMEYKKGDTKLFAVSFDGKYRDGYLDIYYRPPEIYPEKAKDLSRDKVDSQGRTNYFFATIDYLDHNPKCNVVMWSWCSIAGHNVQIYLDNFEALINMYKKGGSKGRTMKNEVKFIFMTGYASGNEGDCPHSKSSPYVNAEAIKKYCRDNKHFCLDYWSQDVYGYEDDNYNPYENGNHNLQHRTYTDSRTMGKDWFKCRDWNSGKVKWPAHCDNEPTAQHLTGNRRAYAAWYIWARIAGWDGLRHN